MKTIIAPADDVMFSAMAEGLIGSEILKIAAEVNELIREGKTIYNFTVGDFNPSIFPIPEELKEEIITAYVQNHTNYPPADGVLVLRQAVAKFLSERMALNYSPSNEILIAGGARPLIYAAYRTIVDPGDYVFYPLPSWNNNHYAHLTGATPVEVETVVENSFLPSAADIEPHLHKLALISLCSPQNPTGTVFSKKQLLDICHLVMEENNRREGKRKPLYILYDQVYNMLTYGNAAHYNPVGLVPEIRDYVLFVDGVSKAFASTGLRVGWAMGNKHIIDKMKSVMSHVGAWAPKAEQVAVANYITNTSAVDTFLSEFKHKLSSRLTAFYSEFMNLKKEGFRVDAVEPQASLYLTVLLQLKGMKTSGGKILKTGEDVMHYLLEEAHLALVPFYAFGASDASPWYRLSVGTSQLEDIPDVFKRLKGALQRLKE